MDDTSSRVSAREIEEIISREILHRESSFLREGRR